MFKPTYLYIKIHNKTGLKYFGKTTQNPFKYKGSGVRWLRHIKKHGYDVTTKIVGFFVDELECKNFAMKFSKDNNIVKSKKWANIVEEVLDGGAEAGKLGYIALQKRLENDSKFRQKIIERKREIALEKIKKGIMPFGGISYDWTGKKHKEETKRKIGISNSIHQKGEKNSCYGLIWINDGNNSTRIKKNLEIPVGWKKGRLNGNKKGIKLIKAFKT